MYPFNPNNTNYPNNPTNPSGFYPPNVGQYPYGGFFPTPNNPIPINPFPPSEYFRQIPRHPMVPYFVQANDYFETPQQKQIRLQEQEHEQKSKNDQKSKNEQKDDNLKEEIQELKNNFNKIKEQLDELKNNKK